VDTAAYTAVVADESARFLAALRGADRERVVPSAPGWKIADLAWHLAEVQWFWGAVVADLVDDVEPLVEPERPADDALLGVVARSSADLVGALERRQGDEPCWSWYEHGGNVAWVARRQAHEAIIHRVDAELAAGRSITALEPGLAADGIDELLGVMLDQPSWGRFTPDGTAVRVETSDTEDRWILGFGRFTGTSPDTGNVYDQDATRVEELVPEARIGTTVRGTAWDLDRWLWGRGPADPLWLGGDVSVAHRLRAVAEVE
jgi:uncharacterized protein (TIGR03083 family)